MQMRGVVGDLRWKDADERCGWPFLGVVGSLRQLEWHSERVDVDQ